MIGLREILGAVAFDTHIELMLSDGYHAACSGYQYIIGGNASVASIAPDVPLSKKGSSVYYHFTDENEIASIFNNSKLLPKGAFKYPAILNISNSADIISPLQTEMTAKIVLVAPVNSIWTKETQDVLLFKPIFDVIEKSFFGNLAKLPYIIKGYDFPTYTRYRGYYAEADSDLKQKFGDYIAYVLFDDIKITIDNNLCERHEKTIVEKFNNLKNKQHG